MINYGAVFGVIVGAAIALMLPVLSNYNVFVMPFGAVSLFGCTFIGETIWKKVVD